MNTTPGFKSLIILLTLVGAGILNAQSIPNTLSFTTAGSFANALAEGTNSVLVYDNNLTNGYESGFDLHDAPTNLNPTGPAGSAAFQWGEQAPASWPYPHSSALWYQPLTVSNAVAEKTFEIGYLYYRNGTIKQNTGASWVELSMSLVFSNPTGLAPINVTFSGDLINTDNGKDPDKFDPVASADIVSLKDFFAPVNFKDSSGNGYFLELSFEVDQDTIDGTLSTADEFRVFEGALGRATLLGRFTTTPGVSPVPEPSSAALLGLAALLITFRRRRN
ncbi:MAG: choice-of-anchor K domain-containing protein [Akkermansiaceae bacterium]|nr:choice-of-anchor K domain-containing protein [Akkermansiaceae bacterium]MDP4646899.1 choice-of-anchor K domain-containing protein [Akkermansiaceae bacterium]MDP4722369.1 choice-of-anchor K domain-containing protein [Akkermansiaceae bacterium]MDP4781231.1 choice-of-anchor K domain-containing protein [Akkermansiaceae bacterium]MDP4847893.1 choice-of-anchor K domain-containing protein [Akkermansiaceae bacterium]